MLGGQGLEDVCHGSPGRWVHLLVGQRKSLRLPTVTPLVLPEGAPRCWEDPHAVPCAGAPVSVDGCVERGFFLFLLSKDSTP